jgi:hypothetical protein
MAESYYLGDSEDRHLAELMLTPAAQQLLAEILAERKEEVLLEALREQVNEKISASDLARASDRTLAASRRTSARNAGSRRRVRERDFLVVGAAGVASMIAVVAALLVPGLTERGLLAGADGFPIQLTIAIGAMVVVALVVTATSVSITIREARKGRAEFASELDGRKDEGFLNDWIVVETGLRELSGSIRRTSDLDRRPFGEVIDDVVHFGAVSLDGEKRIKRLLRARNSIVHGATRGLDEKVLKEDFRAVEAEIRKSMPR